MYFAKETAGGCPPAVARHLRLEPSQSPPAQAGPVRVDGSGIAAAITGSSPHTAPMATTIPARPAVLIDRSMPAQIFTADDGDQARLRLRDAVSQLERRLSKVAAMLEEAEADVLAFYAFPPSTGPSCGPRTRLSDSTARSPGAPTVWGSSPTTPR